MCFHVCYTPGYLLALFGLTGCLRPRACDRACVHSRGQYLGTESRGWKIFDFIISCCLLWSCGAARWVDRGALFAAQRCSAQQRRPAEPCWETPRGNILWMPLSVFCLSCLFIKYFSHSFFLYKIQAIWMNRYAKVSYSVIYLTATTLNIYLMSWIIRKILVTCLPFHTWLVKRQAWGSKDGTLSGRSLTLTPLIFYLCHHLAHCAWWWDK